MECGNLSLIWVRSHTVVVVVDLPLLRVAVEGSDNPISLEKPCQASLPPDQQTHHSLGRHPKVQYMLFEVYRCVQLNRWSVVCGCLHRWQRGEGWWFRRLCVGMILMWVSSHEDTSLLQNISNIT